MADSSREVAAAIAELIHRKRPSAAFLTYIKDHTDGIMSESNTAVGRALPLWPYSASDNVSRSLGSEPDKIAINLAMSFVGLSLALRARAAAGDRSCASTRTWRTAAPPAVVVVGHDGAGGPSRARWPPNRFSSGTRSTRISTSARRTRPASCCWPPATRASYRGFFRLLTEQHIPFAVSENLRWMDDASRRFDLVIAPGRAAGGARTVRPGRRPAAGGRHDSARASGRPRRRPPDDTGLLADPRPHAAAVAEETPTCSSSTATIVELAPLEPPLLTLIPTAMFGPPEKVWSDKVETTVPGLVFTDHGKGRAGLHSRGTSAASTTVTAQRRTRPASRMSIDQLLPAGRQLKTDAHPLVELTVMDQPTRSRTLVHLVNGTGHHDTAYFPPLEMRDIRIELARDVRRARMPSPSIAICRSTSNGQLRSFTVPGFKPTRSSWSSEGSDTGQTRVKRGSAI